MARNLKIYSPRQITINFLNQTIDSGYDDGDFCKIEANADDFELTMGTDGEGARSETGDRSAKFTVMLLQTSDGNAVFSAANNLDRAANNGAGVGPFMIRDRQGTSMYMADKTWVVGPPKSVTFGRKAQGREWVLETHNLVRFDGGN